MPAIGLDRRAVPALHRACKARSFAMNRSRAFIILGSFSLASSVALAGPSRPSGPDGDDGDDGSLPFLKRDYFQKIEQADRQQDPLRYLTGDMGDIATKLSEYQTNKPVQQKQEEVVRNLDVLIKELEKQCKGGGRAGSGGGKPLSESRIVGGKGGQGELTDPKKGDKQWASLPPKQREQILQSQTEGFPPGYESILQSYYRRLSQEQVAPTESSPAAAPSTGTAAPTTRPTNR
jgi:hypothetical protein